MMEKYVMLLIQTPSTARHWELGFDAYYSWQTTLWAEWWIWMHWVPLSCLPVYDEWIPSITTVLEGN